MSDTLQPGDDAVDDTAMFAEITGQEPAVADLQPEPAVVATPEPESTPEPAIPPSRLREEADARRKAEREADELRGRIAAYERQQTAKPAEQEPKTKREIWDDPDGFIQEALSPVQQALAQQAERISMRFAIRDHGKEVVEKAYQALDSALQAGDPNAKAEYQRIRASDDPYDGIVQWHKNSETLKEVGSDPAAYRTRIREEALKDPEFQKLVLENVRGAAQQSGNTVTRPPVSSLPSLSKVGAVALPESRDEPSDAELFSSVTTRRRG